MGPRSKSRYRSSSGSCSPHPCLGDGGELQSVASSYPVELNAKGLNAGVGQLLELVVLVPLGNYFCITVAIGVHPPLGGPGSFDWCRPPLVARELAVYCSLRGQGGLLYSEL